MACRLLPPVAGEGFMTRRARTFGLLAWFVVGIGVAGPVEVAAQSAADKATARQLATNGIQLFRQDKFADALDKLERAEALFDAPVHLLYMARCQVKLNRLVEAAESYRKLLRTELSAQAPQTFKDAVTDGQKELAELEPKVPSLRVDVNPPASKEKEFKFTIDSESVSPAVLGVDRPINPGVHVIEVSARGRQPITRRIEVTIGSKQGLKLELVSAPDAVANGTVGTAATNVGAVDGTTSGASNPVGAGPSSAPESQSGVSGTRDDSFPRRLRILVGVDLAGSLPFAGKLDTQTGTGRGDNRDITGRYGVGGGLELRLGMAIPVASFTVSPLLYVDAFSNAPGPLYKKPADESFGLSNDYNSVMTAEPSSTTVGIGARLDSAPSRAWALGGFGELSFFRQAYMTDGTWKRTNGPPLSCDFTEEYSGFGLRTRGGVLMPVSRLVSLVGSASLGLSTITQGGLTKASCGTNAQWPVDLGTSYLQHAAVPADKRQWHATFGLGLGVEFGIGL
jgi:hypothetical protein